MITVVITAIVTLFVVTLRPEIYYFVLRYVEELMFGFVSGLVVGHYATPDVRDQHQARNQGEKMVRDHFGRTAGKLWTMIWWLPARLIPHRSPLSHLPLFATTLAAAWLYTLPLAVLWWYNAEWFAVAWALLPWHVAGWTVQDTVHLAQDGWRVKW